MEHYYMDYQKKEARTMETPIILKHKANTNLLVNHINWTQNCCCSKNRMKTNSNLPLGESRFLHILAVKQ